MILKKKITRTAFMAIITILSFQDGFSQCFQIESVLVDACGPQEGLNEMVRFKIGAVAQNTSNLSVDWPNNPWQGVVQNATTASNTATLNADILDAGGCGQLIEPTGGVLPANANVILVTSYNLDTALNSFGALTQNVYILYQNNTTVTSGHFANSGTGQRTLSISFGSCSDTVTYDRALLIDTNGNATAADGAIVQYTPNNNATYINHGCSAPVDPFTVNAGPPSVNACAGSTISLNGSAEGYVSVHWSAASGSFSSANNLSTNYTLSPTASGTIQLTLTATNSCGLTIPDVINVNVTNSITPNFTTPLTICNGSTAPVLNATSSNGITGSWLPATVSNTASGDYVFTPNAGQCGTNFTLHVNVSNSITPNFTTPLTICNGSTAPVLNATSPNGITGTWLPATVSNTASGDYVFTPNAGQCAVPFTLSTIINQLEFSIEGKCIENEYILSALPIAESFDPNNVDYEWHNSQGNVVGTDSTLNITDLSENSAIPIVFPATFSLIITNGSGCSGTEAEIVDGVFCKIQKGISANNDNLNDVFDLSGLGVKELKIYNRYGMEVYSHADYTNQWGGLSNNGDELPDATYYYVIAKNNGESITGWIYINR